jgi:A/G-specific adenine glycosylase
MSKAESVSKPRRQPSLTTPKSRSKATPQFSPGEFAQHLTRWFREAQRDLPWRWPENARDPYRVLVSEIMLQQTTVAAVVPFYERFLQRFPTLQSLAAAEVEEVLPLWAGLG